MIVFSIIFGLGLLGMIAMVAIKYHRIQSSKSATSAWYIINWKQNYQLMAKSFRRQSKQILLVGVMLLVKMYRKTLHTSTKSAKNAVRRILFPHNHVARAERPTSTFLNDIIEHKKEIKSNKKDLSE